MKRIILLFFFIIPTLVLSQSEKISFFTVSGKIIDSETKKPIESASIVFRNNHNEIKSGGISNHRGNFSIEVEQGSYKISVEYISYKTKQLSVSTISRSLNIGTVELDTSTEFLNEVEVLAEKRNIEFTPKKMVVNINKDIASSGGLATDVLNNIPSVDVDGDGNVSVRGQATTIMINGRVSSMSKSETLNSLPAGSIEKIEVITNPGASYSASYSSIVNIILKRGKNEGLNASLTAAGGSKDIYGGLLTLNYKTNKINIYSTTNYGHSNPISLAEYQNKYIENGSTSTFLNETNETRFKKNNWNGLIGVELFLSNKTTLTPKISYTNLKYNSDSETKTEIFDASNTLQTSNNRIYENEFNDEILEYSLDFQHNFNEGKTMAAYFLYYDDVEDFDKNINNTNSDFTNEDFIEKNTLNFSEINVKYNHEINENKAFALGYKGEFGNSNFFNTEENIINNIDYIEDIHAVFAEFENQIDKFYYGIGLRAELSKINIHYNDLNTKLNKKYNDLFPTVYLSYDFKDNKSFSLSSSRNIYRPSYDHIQPFEHKISETSSYIGNEKLEPLYIYQNELSYVYSGEKLTVIPALIFNIFDNYWQNVTYRTGEVFNSAEKLITTYANVGDFKQYGLNLTLLYNPNKIFSFSGNLLLNQTDQTGVFKTLNNANENIEIDYESSSFGGNFSLLTQIKIPKLFNFQTNVKYYLESEGAISTRKAYTYSSVAITKDLFQKNATISFNVDDIFKSRETNRDRYTDEYFQQTKFKNKYRTIKLSFTYRFNQSKKQRKIDFDTKHIKPNY